VVGTGGTVVVAAGTYTQNLALARSVRLQGVGSGAAVLAGTNSGAGLNITAAGRVEVSGLTVRNFVAGLLAGRRPPFCP